MSEPESDTKKRVCIVWRGAVETRGQALTEESRLFPVACALQRRGFDVEGAVFSEKAEADFRDQIFSARAALVWVDPLTAGRTRVVLDQILREAADRGVWISAHPDTILKMGTKEVLYSTRELGWGGDTAIYRTFEAFQKEFPPRLLTTGPRVLKQYRGNGGQGVWRVSVAEAPRDADPRVTLQEATHRDGTASTATLREFMSGCEAYFAGTGLLIDQAFQPRIVEGMVRCYMSGARLIGFARQYPAGFAERRVSPDTFGIPAQKTMLPADEPQLQGLRRSLETDWIPGMKRVLAIPDGALPALWDADFLFGPRSKSGEDTFVLCEINVSCVTPFPPEAPERIADYVETALAQRAPGSSRRR